MGEDWSLEEVEATVTDYISMLDKELRGLDYNKTEHRRHLSAILNMRSDGAIERKHQNISAVLMKLRFPSIPGYKPLGNYQQLLYNVVSDRLNNNQTLLIFVRNQVNQPAKIPELDDILMALVKPPSVMVSESLNSKTNVGEPNVRYGFDYVTQEAKNSSLGVAGEHFVVLFEQARLIHEGHDNLASKVEHIAATQGDSAGFDVLSFETTGQERLIEVKTTAYGPLTPFFVTRNELDVSNRNAHGYYLYRTFDFRRNPKIFTKRGPLDRSFKLDPTQYLASTM
jgi:hypothetical protein